MATKGKRGGYEVLEAGGGDMLLFNRGTTGPAGILIPRKTLEKLGGTLGEGDAIWAKAQELVGKRQASTIAVKDLEAASANLTEITLLMPKPDRGPGPRRDKPSKKGASKKSGKAPAKKKKKKK